MFNVMMTNTNRTMIAPALMMITRAAANGAPTAKNMMPVASSETMKYSRACTAFARVIARQAARTEMTAAM
jgi:hypothetical protein